MQKINESSLLEQVGLILGRNGILSKTPGMSFSQIQFDYARHAASGFCRYDALNGKASLNILEAGTGTGKTIGYLVPLMLYAAHTGDRVAVSTFTRQLQKQILDKDAQLVAKWVEQLTGISLSVMRRVGVRNYISPTACERLCESLSAENKRLYKPAITLLNKMIAWTNDPGTSGLLDDFVEDASISEFPKGITLTGIALTHSSPASEMEKYQLAVQMSKSADVLVANHALTMINALRWSAVLDDEELRPVSILVCDEADRLPSVAESVVGADLPLHRLTQAVKSYAALLDKPSYAKHFEALHEHVMSIKPTSDDMVVVQDDSQFSRLLKEARRSILPLEKAITTRMIGSDLSEDDKAVQTLEFLDAVSDLHEFCAAMKSNENSAVVSWSPVRAYPSLRVSRPNPGKLLSRMWNPYDWQIHQDDPDSLRVKRSYLQAALLTSATLATPGRGAVERFDEYANSVGIVRHQNIHNTQTSLYGVFEPTQFGRMSFVLADPSAPVPSMKADDLMDEKDFSTSPEWLDYCATMIRKAHQAGGRCLVLSLSFNDTIELAARLSDLPDLIVHENSRSLPTLLAQYIENPKAILISPAAWEGVNLPGMVNQLVITRIPFSPLNSLQYAQLSLHLKSKGYSVDKINSVINNERVSATRKKLKQGFGRAIRDRNDVATVWIADPRFPVPTSIRESLDEIALTFKPVRVHQSMESCIAKRFLEGDCETGAGYALAKILLVDGRIYQPTII